MLPFHLNRTQSCQGKSFSMAAACSRVWVPSLTHSIVSLCFGGTVRIVSWSTELCLKGAGAAQSSCLPRGLLLGGKAALLLWRWAIILWSSDVPVAAERLVQLKASHNWNSIAEAGLAAVLQSWSASALSYLQSFPHSPLANTKLLVFLCCYRSVIGSPAKWWHEPLLKAVSSHAFSTETSPNKLYQP